MPLFNFSATEQQQENSKTSLKDFLAFFLGLSSVVSMALFLNIETYLKLSTLLLIIAAGFSVYAFSPLQIRLPLLFGLNLISIFILLPFYEAILLVVFALLLFALLIAPISIGLRTILIIIIGASLAYYRYNTGHVHIGGTALPILASLFMFRAILYLHEQKHSLNTDSFWLKINYFFLLPNLVFIIFPVVDYKNFVTSYYKRSSRLIYRKAIFFMANGVFHFFLYRIIYYYFLPNPLEIQTSGQLLTYIIFSYLLIVRLAGIFHFSVGVICLFGFDLPKPFNHYFFASSFNDLWRRINIYWKDFIMKVIYYPVYFKIKSAGTTTAIALSILFTFIISWFLHAYQWFWIRGTILFTVQDISFWMIFGVLVMINSVYLTKYNRNQNQVSNFHLSSSLLHSVKVMAIFFFMAVLWSWWTAPTATSWIDLFSVIELTTLKELTVLVTLLLAVIVMGGLIDYMNYLLEKSEKAGVLLNKSKYAFVVCGLFVLSSIGHPLIGSTLSGWLSMDLNPVIKTELNDADRNSQFQGYYETMLSGHNLLESPLEELESQKPDDWYQLHTLDALEHTNDILIKQLKPDLDITFKGARFQTNNLGLRDRPTTIDRPDGVLRIALLGGSIEMGSGVTTDQTYENLVEDRLNRENLFKDFRKVEILNFAVSGIHLPQHIARADSIIPKFKPHVVIYTSHSDEIRRIMTNLYRIYTDTIDYEYRYLDSIYSSLSLPRTTSISAFKFAVEPKMMDLIEWGLLHIKHKVEEIGAIPVWVFVPSLDGKYTPEEDALLIEQAKQLGFYVLDLREFNGEVPESELILGEWDRHPNAYGHQLLANKLFEVLVSNEELVQTINSIKKE